MPLSGCNGRAKNSCEMRTKRAGLMMLSAPYGWKMSLNSDSNSNRGISELINPHSFEYNPFYPTEYNFILFTIILLHTTKL